MLSSSATRYKCLATNKLVQEGEQPSIVFNDQSDSNLSFHFPAVVRLSVVLKREPHFLVASLVTTVISDNRDVL